MKKALITGIAGQDGSYLAEYLLDRGYEVAGILHHTSYDHLHNIEHIKDSLKLYEGDLIDRLNLKKLILDFNPDEIYNLAAQSFVPLSYEKTKLTFDVNVIGVINLLDIIKDFKDDIRFFQASSAEIFGNCKVSPQNEDTDFSPDNPYAISKLSSHLLVKSYREKYGLFASSGILYNHESPRRGENFLTRKISINASKIKKGLIDKLALGNLESKRDWGFAKDYVKAMYMINNHKVADEFVIATGKVNSVKDFCEKAFSYLDLDYKDYVYVDENFYRPTEKIVRSGSIEKIKRVLGWEPETSLDELVKMMVDKDMGNIY